MRAIYRFKIYNINTDSYEVSEKIASQEYIQSIKGAIQITETKIEVSDKHLNEQGYLLEKELKNLDLQYNGTTNEHNTSIN